LGRWKNPEKGVIFWINQEKEPIFWKMPEIFWREDM
jgi:hypothetical protein